MNNTAERIQQTQELIQGVKQELAKVIIGQTHMLNSLLIGLFADGHILLEGVPGIAKTLSANALAKILELDFKRIQFTPDLLPADLTGTQIYHPKDETFSVNQGPIFTNILLADEINRAPAKVQSALLEVMQEKQVTIGRETFPVPAPFFVIATQNPIEQEGTYILSEAQTDRFMLKVKMGYPSRQEEKQILNRTVVNHPLSVLQKRLTADQIVEIRALVDEIYIDDKVINYLLDLTTATRHPEQFKLNDVAGLLEYGASPRAALALKQAAKANALIEGRYFVTPQDIKDLCQDAFRHRLRLSYEAEAENVTVDDVLKRIMDAIPVP